MQYACITFRAKAGDGLDIIAIIVISCEIFAIWPFFETFFAKRPLAKQFSKIDRFSALCDRTPRIRVSAFCQFTPRLCHIIDDLGRPKHGDGTSASSQLTPSRGCRR